MKQQMSQFYRAPWTSGICSVAVTVTDEDDMVYGVSVLFQACQAKLKELGCDLLHTTGPTEIPEEVQDAG